MSTTMQPAVFQFHTHAVRVFPTDDGLSFVAVAKDVARILNYRDAADFLRQVPDAHKGTQKVRTPYGDQEMRVVDEAGLYRGVLRSNKPEAEPFMEWVTAEVLPSIRRTGGYVKPQTSCQLAMAEEIGALRDQVRSREALLQAKDQVIIGLQHRLIGSQGGQIRLLRKVASMERRQAIDERKATVIRMWSQGKGRAEISEVTGLRKSYIGKIVCDARQDGRLPPLAD